MALTELGRLSPSWSDLLGRSITTWLGDRSSRFGDNFVANRICFPWREAPLLLPNPLLPVIRCRVRRQKRPWKANTPHWALLPANIDASSCGDSFPALRRSRDSDSDQSSACRRSGLNRLCSSLQPQSYISCNSRANAGGAAAEITAVNGIRK